MSIDTSAIDMLGSGGKTAKFENVGDTVKGRVVSATATQQTEYGSNALKTWPDGKPMMQLVVTLDTDDRDPDDANDDGQRKVYVKGKMLQAVRAALAGRQLEEGATLAVQYTGNGTAKPGMNPPKEYRAQYEPAPAISAEASSLI